MSKYFQPAEAACHDGTPYPQEWLGDETRWVALAATADAIREEWGGPLAVISGYRTPAHNAAVGGASASQHMEGRAFDLRPNFWDGQDLAETCARLHALILRMFGQGKLPLLGGLGLYAGWVHIDVRQRPGAVSGEPASGHLARWVGAGIGSEVAQ